ncbi:MAG: tRNA (adenosine(37)-N6)-threonylcarbamoyltransferase complex dimerization subunit type 1 TsaB [Desulfotalea sp.]
MDEVKILAIDTTSTCSAIAITSGDINDGKVLASLSLNTRITHSRRLLSSIAWLMEQVEIEWSDLDGIGVNLGPGSFTGLRIGMATAKGLAMAAELPMLGISSLDVLALRVVSEKTICTCLDARKKEVYACRYKWQDGTLVPCSEYSVLSMENLLDALNEETIFVGDGAVCYKQLIIDHKYASLAPSPLNAISAETLGLACAGHLIAGKDLDLANSGPIYVRSSDAELNLGVKIEPIIPQL